MEVDISTHVERFKAYAARCIARASGPEAEPMRLKRGHTMAVLANARAIVTVEAPAPDLARATVLAALYHDVGRFEQCLRYCSFKDAQTCNHALLGVKIAKREKMLAGEDPRIAGIALAVIGLHNRFALPPKLPADVLFAANVVRDADKLDILRIIDEHLAATPYNPTVVLSLPDNPDIFSPTVIDTVLAGRVASYGDLRSVNDFRLLLGSWLYAMNFAGSREQFLRDGHARSLVMALPREGVYKAPRNRLLAEMKC